MKLTLEIIGRSQFIVGLDRKRKAVLENVNRAIVALGYRLERYVKQSKLHGQVLHQRTGRLAGSVHTEVEQGGEAITSASVGTNVVYAHPHEYGATIAHPGGTAYVIDFRAASSGLRVRWVPNSDPRSAFLPRTRPHPIRLPERSFLRSALADMQAAIVEGVTGAVQKGLEA